MLRSAAGSIVVVSVALLLPLSDSVTPVGAATVAVLVRVPVAVELTLPVKVKVTLCPEARFSPVQAPVLLL